jgi:hypothetical protein
MTAAQLLRWHLLLLLLLLQPGCCCCRLLSCRR